MEVEKKLSLLGDVNQIYVQDGKNEFIETATKLYELAVNAIMDSTNLAAIPYEFNTSEGICYLTKFYSRTEILNINV